VTGPATGVDLTGLSMGGYGTWALAAAHPERFAAIAPVCGGGNPRDVARIRDLPFWVFHGAKDSTVPSARSEDRLPVARRAAAACGPCGDRLEGPNTMRPGTWGAPSASIVFGYSWPSYI
jgi:pimeloyl-ACP methyl ester carboxylesterase